MRVHVSTLTSKELEDTIETYGIPRDLRPRLPDPKLTMNKLPTYAAYMYNNLNKGYYVRASLPELTYRMYNITISGVFQALQAGTLVLFWKQNRPKSKNAKVRVNTEESAVKPEPELKNTIGCNLNPSDGPGKPNSITVKTVKTKWALNQFQQPICVQLTKTVKTLKAQS
ncbi:hypothetical protein Tco_0135251 [Tanacetum coccineum]